MRRPRARARLALHTPAQGGGEGAAHAHAVREGAAWEGAAPTKQLARQPPKGSGSRREQVGQKGGEEAAPEQVEAEHDEEHL